MRVLITRPRDDAEALARTLASRGIESLIEPLLEIRPLANTELDLDGVQAILLTSANGARALAAASATRAIPVLAVGDSTAAAARAAGFTEVETAGGDVEALEKLAADRCDPGGGPLLHVAGSIVAGDLAGRLVTHGFAVRRTAPYEACPVSGLSDAAVAALADGAIDAVLLFSPRTAAAFVRFAHTAEVTGPLSRMRALCLSEAVAEAARAMTWREVCVADRPDQAALLALVMP